MDGSTTIKGKTVRKYLWTRPCPPPVNLNGNTSVPSHTSHWPSGVPARMRKESDRLEAFVNWSSGASVRPRDLARAGFFYVGTGDRVQCGFSEGVLRNWEPGDQPIQDHRRHFSTFPFVQRLEVGSIPLQAPNTTLPLPVSETQNHVVHGSPPRSENTTSGATLGILTARPRHESYVTESTRAQAFANWPPTRIPRPEELARAGFFYTGIGDNVKCFFCDGELRNWEPQDDPRVEHARLFPSCGFVRQCKGDAFIQMTKKQNSPNNPPPQAQAQAQGPRGAPGSYHVDAREIKARLDTPKVQAVLDMGFIRDTVRQAIERRLRDTGDDFPSAESLIDAVLNNEDEMNREMVVRAQEEPGQQPLGEALAEAPAPWAIQNTFPAKETKSLLEENKRLKEERTCRICMDEDVSVVFEPCGHLAACVQCSTIDKCPVCGEVIRSTLRVAKQ